MKNNVDIMEWSCPTTQLGIENSKQKPHCWIKSEIQFQIVVAKFFYGYAYFNFLYCSNFKSKSNVIQVVKIASKSFSLAHK